MYALCYGKALKVTNAHRTLAGLTTLSVLLVFSVSSALAHRGRVFGPSFGAPGSGAGQLSLAAFPLGKTRTAAGSGIGVNEATHNIYVADTGNDRVDEFSSTGAFVRAWGWGVQNGASEFQVCTDATGCRAGLSGTSPGQFESPAFVAVDNSPGGEGDVYVSDFSGQGGEPRGIPLVQKFTAEGALIESWGSKGQVTSANGPEGRLPNVGGVAVFPDGTLVVGTESGAFEFRQASGAYIERIGTGEVATEFANGVSVDAAGNLYFDIPATLTVGRFNPTGGKTETVFRSSTAFSGLAVSQSGELYLDEGNAIQVIAPSCITECAPSVTFTSPLLTNGVGLAVDSPREVVYIAETAAEKIESIVPEPPAAPLVQSGSQSVSDVSADSGTLEAEVNPRSEPDEESTSYRFQYTTEEQFQREGFAGASSIPVPDGQLAPNFEADLVTAHPQGLAPHTVYRYRVVAENAISRKEGKPTEGEHSEAGEEVVRTFTTQTLGVFALLDGRAWELVSPANKHGALIRSLQSDGVTQASVDGDAFTYLASAPTESTPEAYSNDAQTLSTRAATGASSWTSRDITTPRDVTNGLRLGLQEYRFFSSDLSLSIVNPFGAFVPSMSAEASEQTAFLRTDFPSGEPSDPCLSSCYRPLVTGAPGFANVPEGTEFGEGTCHTGRTRECGPLFVAATPDGSHVILQSVVALTEGGPTLGLYEWSEGQLQLVSILPESEGGTPTTPGLGSINAAGHPVIRNAISADGARVVWSAGSGNRKLYLRDLSMDETVELGAGAEFQTASNDDERVFFTKGGDLYVFEAPTGGALSAGHTTDLTPGANVVGVVPGASADGTSVYFVANRVLTSAPSPHGESAVPGDCISSIRSAQPEGSLCDLYVWHDGVTRLVAVLSGEDDSPLWALEEGLGVARVSPNGRWLGFMSARSLTGYDNRDVSSGEADEEVFLYDSTANGGQGDLVCASCDPTGARPHGVFDVGAAAHFRLVDKQIDWAGRWLAGSVPAWTSPVYQSRYLSDTGRLFFNSPDALVASDTNGMEDVYEYEPANVGGCTRESTSFGSGSDGCVDLVSSGVSKEESAFLDASESGDDVFFLTSGQLSPADSDLVRDVYDARVGGGFIQPTPPPSCEGDACQSPVAAPNDPTPGSLTYKGPGNPVPLLTMSKATAKKAVKCREGKRPAHGKCVKGKSKKKKAKKAGKPGNRRRVKS